MLSAWGLEQPAARRRQWMNPRLAVRGARGHSRRRARGRGGAWRTNRSSAPSTARRASSLERWTAAQSRASALFSSAASVVERLPLLADDARFGPLARRFPNLPSRARDAQAEALGRVLDALEVELALFRELVGAMEKLHRDGSQLVAASGPAAAGAARLGPAPSLAESTTGLHDLWRLHRDESALKDALARELTCDASPEDLASARAIFDAEPNLDPNHIREIVERVPVRAADGSTPGRR